MMEMFKIEAVWRGGGERKKVRRQSQQSDSRNSSLTAQSQYFTGGCLSVLNYCVLSFTICRDISDPKMYVAQ